MDVTITEIRLKRAWARLGMKLLTVWLLFTSCLEADVRTRDGSITEGDVQILPDASVYQVSAFQYHFYNTDGITPYLTTPCDGSGNFRGKLPIGTYRVIATNLDAQNAVFNNMHDYKQAIVAHSILPSESEAIILSQPGWLYSIVLDDLAVTADSPTLREPCPTQLTKELILTFIMDAQLQNQASSLSGRFLGACPSIHLYTGNPVVSHTRNEGDPVILFTSLPTETGEWTASLRLLGLYAQYGTEYPTMLNVSLKLSDGSTLDTEVDLTEELYTIIKQNEGNIPIRIPLQIKLSLIGIELNAEVSSWQNSGSSEVGIEKPE